MFKKTMENYRTQKDGKSSHCHKSEENDYLNNTVKKYYIDSSRAQLLGLGLWAQAKACSNSNFLLSYKSSVRLSSTVFMSSEARV